MLVTMADMEQGGVLTVIVSNPGRSNTCILKTDNVLVAFNETHGDVDEKMLCFSVSGKGVCRNSR